MLRTGCFLGLLSYYSSSLYATHGAWTVNAKSTAHAVIKVGDFKLRVHTQIESAALPVVVPSSRVSQVLQYPGLGLPSPPEIRLIPGI